MTAILAIDLGSNMSHLSTLPGGGTASQILYYAYLRALYNLPPILPIAAAIGITLAEMRLVHRLERPAMAGTGRPLLTAIVPALAVGLLLALPQQLAVSWWRPLSVEDQGASGFRDYGARFRAGETEPRWIAVGNTMLRARLAFAEGGVTLKDVLALRLDGANRVDSIFHAPTAAVDHGVLVLRDATCLNCRAGHDRWTPIALDAAWLADQDIEPQLLSSAELNHLATVTAGIPDQTAYRATAAMRRSAWLKPLAIALLAATLSLFLMRPRMGLKPPLLAALATYAYYFAGGCLEIMAGFGALNPYAAALALPLLTILACLAMLLRDEWIIAARLRKASAMHRRERRPA